MKLLAGTNRSHFLSHSFRIFLHLFGFLLDHTIPPPSAYGSLLRRMPGTFPLPVLSQRIPHRCHAFQHIQIHTHTERVLNSNFWCRKGRTSGLISCSCHFVCSLNSVTTASLQSKASLALLGCGAPRARGGKKIRTESEPLCCVGCPKPDALTQTRLLGMKNAPLKSTGKSGWGGLVNRVFLCVCPTLRGGGVRISGWVGFQTPPPLPP